MTATIDEDRLSLTFAALANTTRREILARLADGAATVNDLAEPFECSLPAISKHLKVLERAGLVTRESKRANTDRVRSMRHRFGTCRRGRSNTAPSGKTDSTEWTSTSPRFKRNPKVTDAVVIERTFDAPVELIWRMWTDPELFRTWYGPAGATIPVAHMDVRVGGIRHVCMEMQTPNGPMQMWFVGEHREVIENERLVYTESMSDEAGNVVDPVAMGMPGGTSQND